MDTKCLNSENSVTKICKHVNKIWNRITFSIKDGCSLEMVTAET